MIMNKPIIKILEEWIAGRGKHPVTWNTLIEFLHGIKLTTLAGEIAAVKLLGGGEDSDQRDCGENPAELITDLKLSTLATEFEAVKLPLEDRHTEDAEDSNQRTASDACT